MPGTLTYVVTKGMVWVVTSYRSALCEMAEKWRSHLAVFHFIIMTAQHGLWSCSLCCFLKTANTVRFVMWQCTVSSLISNVFTFFSFSFSLFIVFLLFCYMKYLNRNLCYLAPAIFCCCCCCCYNNHDFSHLLFLVTECFAELYALSPSNRTTQSTDILARTWVLQVTGLTMARSSSAVA